MRKKRKWHRGKGMEVVKDLWHKGAHISKKDDFLVLKREVQQGAEVEVPPITEGMRHQANDDK